MDTVRSIIVSKEAKTRTRLRSDLTVSGMIEVVAEADWTTDVITLCGKECDALIVAGEVRGHAITTILEVRKRFSHLPIIVHGPNSKKSKMMAEALGVDAYVTRTGRPENLVAVVRGIVEAKRQAPPSTSRIKLTRREQEVTNLHTRGFSQAEIAVTLTIQPESVKRIVNRMKRKGRDRGTG